MRILKNGKVNTFLIGIVMMVILLGCSSQAQASNNGIGAYCTEGDYRFHKIDGKAIIIQYNGNDQVVDVPAILDGAPVTVIDVAAFSNKDITSVTLPDSLRGIGMGAFKDSDITSIVIPQGVTSIGEQAFSNCSKLTSVTIPNNLKSMGEGVFSRCISLTSIVIPQGVTSIGDSAFDRCTGLTSVSISDSVTSIGGAAFGGCTSLSSVSIPGSVTSIGTRAFGDCTSLSSVIIDEGLQSIGGAAFGGCTGLTSIVIPKGVTSIGSFAFRYTGLSSVSIPDSVNGIGSNAFIGTDLSSITFNSATTTIISGWETIPSDTKIIGYDPSTAKDFAEKNGNPFETIGGASTTSPSTSSSSNSSSSSSTTTNPASSNNPTSTQNNTTTPTPTVSNPTQGSDNFPDGSKYVGEMSHGLPNGQGTFTWPDGSKYVGNYKDGLKQGQGTLTIAEGDKYVGEWRDDMLNGQGSYTAPNGETYVGTYKNNKKDGQGTHTWPSGEKYVGKYKDGLKNGQGTYTWPNGNKYVGEYKDDLKNGQGTYTWPDGKKYIGTWKDGVKYGEGTYYFPDGHLESGQWQGDKFVNYAKTNKPTATTATNNSAPSAVNPTNNSASGGVSVYVNNAPVSFPDQQPFIDQNGRTQVPLRAAGQAMGLAIAWDDASKTVTLSKDGKTAQLTIDSNSIYIDGRATVMDTSPMLVGGRTVLPFRYVAQAFGANVSWDPMSKRATVSQGNNSISQNSTKSTENNQSFFGEWKITKTIGLAPVVGMTDDEAASYIGKKLIIAQYAFTDLDGSVVKNPSYKQKTVSNEEFYEGFHMKLDAIGVKSSSINEIEISNASSDTGFYLIDENNIIYALDGVFFKLQK